jgi:hypothetical protein
VPGATYGTAPPYPPHRASKMIKFLKFLLNPFVAHIPKFKISDNKEINKIIKFTCMCIECTLTFYFLLLISLS